MCKLTQNEITDTFRLSSLSEPENISDEINIDPSIYNAANNTETTTEPINTTTRMHNDTAEEYIHSLEE